MLLYSLDTETTGLDPNFCQLLEIGIIEWDTKTVPIFENLRKLKLRVIQNKIIGQPFALQLNSHILLDLHKYLQIKSLEEKINFQQNLNVIYCKEEDVEFLIGNFINNNVPLTNKIHITACGKNFASFDFQFLKKLPNWGNLVQIRHRIPDPCILYIDWSTDDVPPSMDVCKQRMGSSIPVSHDSLYDAFDVIELIHFYIEAERERNRLILEHTLEDEK